MPGTVFIVAAKGLELEVDDQDGDGKFDLTGDEGTRDVVHQPQAIDESTGDVANPVRQLYEIIHDTPDALHGLSIQGVFAVITALDLAYARKNVSDFDAPAELVKIKNKAGTEIVVALSSLFDSAAAAFSAP